MGNHNQGFDRLIKKMDDIASRIDEKVIMQTGYTGYKPKNADYFSFLDSFEEIRKLNRDARVVVSHAGVGSIITALEEGTPVVIVPRRKKYDEHTDDHQLEIAEAMANNPKIKVVYDVVDLENCLRSSFKSTDTSFENNLSRAIKKYLLSLS